MRSIIGTERLLKETRTIPINSVEKSPSYRKLVLVEELIMYIFVWKKDDSG